jgi:Do/DeqQ family serine protease
MSRLEQDELQRARAARRRGGFVRPALVALALIAFFASEAAAEDPFLRHTATVKVAKEVGPAVVSITSPRTEERNPFGRHGQQGRRFFKDVFDPRRGRSGTETKDLELGSGVIIDPKGHVLTNEHVISSASRIIVKLADGRSFNASVVGADPNNDLAVLQIETEENLPFVQPGRSDDLLVGEPVIAIGNPFGLSNTVTTGVISAIDRSFTTPDRSYSFHGFIQTDASINPGNSGGPLLNAEGRLIAINSALYNGANGIGFAIPIDVAKRVVSELIEHGEVTPIWLGAEFQDLDNGLYEVLEVPSGSRGVLITGVSSDSPAARAGLERGDVMLSIDGREISGAPDALDQLKTVLVDQDLQIDVWRRPKRVGLTLRTEEIPTTRVRELARDLLGLALEEQAGGTGFGITGVRRGTKAEAMGLRPGDRLLRVNGRRLRNNDDLRRAIVDLRGMRQTSVVVQRGTGRYLAILPLV